jgi:hypothetical protein
LLLIATLSVLLVLPGMAKASVGAVLAVGLRHLKLRITGGGRAGLLWYCWSGQNFYSG